MSTIRIADPSSPLGYDVRWISAGPVQPIYSGPTADPSIPTYYVLEGVGDGEPPVLPLNENLAPAATATYQAAVIAYLTAMEQEAQGVDPSSYSAALAALSEVFNTPGLSVWLQALPASIDEGSTPVPGVPPFPVFEPQYLSGGQIDLSPGTPGSVAAGIQAAEQAAWQTFINTIYTIAYDANPTLVNEYSNTLTAAWGVFLAAYTLAQRPAVTAYFTAQATYAAAQAAYAVGLGSLGFGDPGVLNNGPASCLFTAGSVTLLPTSNNLTDLLDAATECGYMNLGTVCNIGSGGGSPVFLAPQFLLYGQSVVGIFNDQAVNNSMYVVVAGTQPQNLFTFVNTALNGYLAADAAFSTTALPGYSTWTWPLQAGDEFVAGTQYKVIIA